MDTENRRSFVRKSLATSVTISFSGLIRAAHGETVETTIDPWSDETTDTLGLNSDYTSGFELTIPTDYTINQWSAWSIDPVTDDVLTDPPTECDHAEGKIGECFPWTMQNPYTGQMEIKFRKMCQCGAILECQDPTHSQ